MAKLLQILFVRFKKSKKRASIKLTLFSYLFIEKCALNCFAAPFSV